MKRSTPRGSRGARASPRSRGLLDRRATCTTAGSAARPAREARAAAAAFKPTAQPRIVWRGEVGAGRAHDVLPGGHRQHRLCGGRGGPDRRVRRRAPARRSRASMPASGSPAGVAASGSLIVVGTGKGEVLAFDAGGKPLWKAPARRAKCSRRRRSKARSSSRASATAASTGSTRPTASSAGSTSARRRRCRCATTAASSSSAARYSPVSRAAAWSRSPRRPATSAGTDEHAHGIALLDSASVGLPE